jgi:HlyD family secretion protein
MIMKWRQIVIIVLVLAAGAVGVWWAFRPQPIGVDLALVERGTLVVTVDDEGVVRVKDTYEVSTPIGGAVERTPFTVGDLVEKDAVVATIVPQLSGFLDDRTLAEARAAVRAAEAAVTAAKTDIAVAESELLFWQGEADRVSRLMERGVASKQAAEEAQFQLERRELMLANAKVALDLRLSQLDQAQARLLEPNGSGERTIRYDIRSPVAGQVLQIANESARSLPSGAHLLTIGDPRNLEVTVDLLSTDAVRIVAGAPAMIDGWGRDVELEAQVRRIEPIGFTKISALGIEEQRVRVRLDILSDPTLWQSLGHLYRIFVRIQVEKIDDAVLVPTAALFRSDNEWAVYVHEDGLAHLRNVTLGARDSGMAEVQTGLEPGAQVILHPSDRIVDGGLIVDRQALSD